MKNPLLAIGVSAEEFCAASARLFHAGISLGAVPPAPERPIRGLLAVHLSAINPMPWKK